MKDKVKLILERIAISLVTIVAMLIAVIDYAYEMSKNFLEKVAKRFGK